jgi:ribonuclease HI
LFGSTCFFWWKAPRSPNKKALIYLGASAIVVRGITNSATLEALACREALALAEDLNLQRIFVSSDCKTVVTDIAEGSIGRYGAVIKEIKERSALFQESSFMHVRRPCFKF